MNVTEDVRKKFIAHDRTIGLHDVRLSEIDLRLQCTETANFEGVLIWKIGGYRQRKLQAVGGRLVSLYSQPFYTSRYGYKMCARIYLNGDGAGRGSHLSLFFVVMQVTAVLRLAQRTMIILKMCLPLNLPLLYMSLPSLWGKYIVAV